LSYIKLLLMLLLIGGLLASNYMLLTSLKFHGFLFDALAKVAPAEFLDDSLIRKQLRLERENLVFRQKHMARAAKIRVISGRIVRRSVRTATLNVSSLPAEAVPFVGIATVLAVTAVDVKDACDTISDLDEILAEFEEEGGMGEKEKVCGMEIPTLNEIKEKIRN